MKHSIIVIGGGISGLATLHYLKKKYADRDDCEILLIERSDHVGGVLNTLVDVGSRFETGGNAFINNSPRTLELIDDLGLSEQVIQADPENKRRYLCVTQKLHQLPQGPLDLLKFPLLKFADKLRIIRETSVKSRGVEGETMHQFMSRRFSSSIADLMAGPVVSGIYAGDPSQIVVEHAFPKLWKFEQEHGSILKGLSRSRDKSKPRPTLHSFKNGMGTLTQALQQKYHGSIITRQEVESIEGDANRRYSVVTPDKIYRADQIFLTLPAYRAAHILSKLNGELAEPLKSINYAPIALVGFVCSKNDFMHLPPGFGYLKPSFEDSPILGVLFESQIFKNRTQFDQCLLRLMIGGARHADILQFSKKEIIGMARREIVQTLGFKGEPYHIFFKAWNKAIPQYDQTYHQARPQIEAAMQAHPQIILSGNYWGGVSVNDCIRNAHDRVASSNI